MELRQGYKQTDVGVIPEDWDALKLGNIASFRTGPFGSALHKSDYVVGGIPIVNPMQIIDGKIRPTETMSISQDAANNLSEFRLRVKDIVIGRRGEMGRCAYVLEEQSGWLCGTGSMIVRTTQGIDGQFLQRQFSSPSIISKIENTSVGSTMINLNQATLSNLIIPLPPTLVEQEAIAGALSDVDGLIAALETLITKKRHIKHGTMQELLRPKEGWVGKRLGDVVEIVMGQSPSSSNYNAKGSGLPLIQGNADISDRMTIKRIYTTQITKLGKRDDIIMTVRAPVGEISVASFDVCLGRGVCAIRGANNFIYHLLVLKEARWEKLSKGSTFDSVNSEDVKALEISLPIEKNEQTAIAAILSDMDAEIAALEKKLAKTRQLKQGMMGELLTGRIRLI